MCVQREKRRSNTAWTKSGKFVNGRDKRYRISIVFGCFTCEWNNTGERIPGKEISLRLIFIGFLQVWTNIQPGHKCFVSLQSTQQLPDTILLLAMILSLVIKVEKVVRFILSLFLLMPVPPKFLQRIWGNNNNATEKTKLLVSKCLNCNRIEFSYANEFFWSIYGNER